MIAIVSASYCYMGINGLVFIMETSYVLCKIRTEFADYNQQDATFHNLFISVRRSTCFRRVCRPSSGAQNCTYSVRYLSDQYCYLLSSLVGMFHLSQASMYVQFWVPDDGRKTRLKHETCTASYRNKLWNVASCWLYSANILAMNGPMNVKYELNFYTKSAI